MGAKDIILTPFFIFPLFITFGDGRIILENGYVTYHLTDVWSIKEFPDLYKICCSPKILSQSMHIPVVVESCQLLACIETII